MFCNTPCQSVCDIKSLASSDVCTRNIRESVELAPQMEHQERQTRGTRPRSPAVQKEFLAIKLLVDTLLVLQWCLDVHSCGHPENTAVTGHTY